MGKSYRRALIVVLGVASASWVVWFPTASRKGNEYAELNFEEHVLPIFRERCVECHGPELAEAGLRLDSLAAVMSGSRLRSVVNPGQSRTSEILRRIAGPKASMPPGSRLDALDVAVIARWIDLGEFKSPDGDEESVDHSNHWAWHRPRSTFYSLSIQPGFTPIDGLVGLGMKGGIRRAEPANRYAIIRRLSVDLIGLIPSIEEVDEFVADDSPDAVVRQVNRLLASPSFGEHWGRHWLDLARFADTNGYHRDTQRPISLYRDWVINAFNSDQPFDEFTRDQLAGDLVTEPSRDQIIATGFHRNTMFNQEGGVDPEEFRVKSVMDRVETTATIWLGMTFRCARCHKHPHDPISQRDYYRLFAYFNGTADTGGGKSNRPEPVIELASPKQRQHLDQVRDAIEVRTNWLRDHGGTVDPEQDSELATLLRQQQELWSVIPTSLVLAEAEEPRQTYVLDGGDFLSPTVLVEPGVPGVLRQRDLKEQPDSRLELATWLVSEENPLAARVAVNRMWEKLFGRGIVRTAADFGAHGAAPDHPELLDWLASEYRRTWSRKSLLRTIVSSQAYQRSSDADSDQRALDPQNVHLGRGARFRMDAEVIRDSTLFAAGLLDRAIGGKSVHPPQPDGLWESIAINRKNTEFWIESEGSDRWRRGVYTYWRRSSPYPSFMILDAPSREYCTVSRSRTNTPLQALVTLNDPAFVEAASALAARMMYTGSLREKLAHGFRLCATRPPTHRELDELVMLHETLEDEVNSSIDEKLRWTVIANVLLNLDATLSRW